MGDLVIEMENKINIAKRWMKVDITWSMRIAILMYKTCILLEIV